jgi:hypothetical protein
MYNDNFPIGIPIPAISGNLRKLCTIETLIAETQDSGSVCNDRDFHIFGWISFKNFVNMALVLQTDMKAFRVDVNMRKSLTSFSDNRLHVSTEQRMLKYSIDVRVYELQSVRSRENENT